MKEEIFSQLRDALFFFEVEKARELAEKVVELGIDPVEIRLINAREAGETTNTGSYVGSCAMKETIRQVATDETLPLIDHTRHWQEHADSHNYWMSDAFHPNNLGHRAFARLLYQELGIWDENSPSCRLFVP